MSIHFGDRRDGVYLRDVDSLHTITPLIFPDRCDNEAFIMERIDLTKVNAYLEKKNAANPVYHYNLFQVIVTALFRTVTLRPKMNRFIVNHSIYQRKKISAAFVVKKQFSDEGGEALAILYAKKSDTIETVHDEIYRQITASRAEKADKTTACMDFVQKLPRVCIRMIGAGARFLDRYGLMPQSVIATDPYYASVVVANLGSIKLHAAYHHLTNWGTCSVFCVIGEKKKRPFYDEEGHISMRDSIDLGLTIDERIADGYYYSRTIGLLKKLLENPELLEEPLSKEVEY